MREHLGSHAKSLGIGRVSQGGLEAAFLAAGRMESSIEAIDEKRGWITCVWPNEKVRLERLEVLQSAFHSGNGRDGDGKWEIEKNAFKPFSCGDVIHSIIDGCIQLRRSQGFAVEGVEKITLRVHPLVLELTGRKESKDRLQAKFTVHHGAACGLMLGKATPKEYEDHVVTNFEIVRLRSKIMAHADERIKPDECQIAVELTDGMELEKHVQPGGPHNA